MRSAPMPAAAAGRIRANPRCALFSYRPAERADRVGIVSKAALARKHGRDALSPKALGSLQDAQLVVHEDIVFGRVAPLDIVQGFLLVDVDQHVPIYGLG